MMDSLCSCGFSGVWDNQSFPNKKWLVSAVRQKQKDIFITNWLSLVENSNSGINYRIFKNRFCFEQYLVSLPTKQLKFFMQIRTRNHRLPIETGRWQKIQRKEGVRNLCKSEIGDEFHYVLVCKRLENIRRQYLNRYFYIRPNTVKFFELFNSKNTATLRKLCEFIDAMFSIVKCQ